MSRFSPNSLLDAATLPFAMVQYRSNIYVETIAPDVRPAVFAIALVCLAIVISMSCLRKNSGRRSNAPAGRRVQTGVVENRRMAVAMVLATTLALTLWIASSANGRYGLMPITLCAPAIVAAVILLSRSKKTRLMLIGAALAGQVLLLTTANPSHTWTQLTPNIWSEPHALGYPAGAARAAGLERGTDVVVISPRTQTAMSAAWQLFGAEPVFMNAAYLVDAYSFATAPMQRAMGAIKRARVMYAIFATPEVSKLSGGRKANKNSDTQFGESARVSLGDRARLQVLGAILDESSPCTVMPPRMGAHLVVCRLIRTVPSRASMTELPARPLELAKRLAQACPRLFGEMLGPGPDGAGGVELKVHDGKYSLAITGDGKIYAKPRNDWNYRLVADAEVFSRPGGDSADVFENSELERRCREFAPPGTQYFE